jgi:molybdenum cofactor biosynthesis enzyme MoaA
VYEKVRTPAKWEQLIRSMEFIRELRKVGLPHYYCLFVTRRANAQDAANFVDFAKSYGADKIRFALFDKIWHSEEQYAEELLTADEINDLIKDFRFDQPGVNASVLKAAAKGIQCWG